MKKQFLLQLLFVFSLTTFAQAVKDSTDIEYGFYFGVGLQSQPNLNINSKLINANLPTVPETMPESIFGFNVFGKKYSGSLELSGVIVERSRGSNKTRYETGNVRGNFSYNFIVKPKIAFTAGLNVAYSTVQFDIFSENAVIDFDNLNPNANGGHLQLNNCRLFAGPAMSLHLFRESWFRFRLTAAYEFGVTRGLWGSDFINVTNAVSEAGKNRFLFSIVF